VASSSRPDLDACRSRTWLKSTSLETVEIMAYAGFDFVIIDMEHAPLALPNVYAHIVNRLGAGGRALVGARPRRGTIARVLDSGRPGSSPRTWTTRSRQPGSRLRRFRARPPRLGRTSGRRAGAARAAGVPAVRATRKHVHRAVGEPGRRWRTPPRSWPYRDRRGVRGRGRPGAETGMAAPTRSYASSSTACCWPRGRPQAGGMGGGQQPGAARAAYARGFGFVVMGNDLSMLAERACSLVELPAAIRAPARTERRATPRRGDQIGQHDDLTAPHRIGPGRSEGRRAGMTLQRLDAHPCRRGRRVRRR